KKVFWGVLEH
ncbi:hypothetical protein HPF78_1224, partial [Helicobacter pylori]